MIIKPFIKKIFYLKKIFISVFIILLLIPVFALTIENVTIKATAQNYTIYVNGSINLNKTIITNSSIEFYNISDGGKFDNPNDTYVSNLSFYGLDYSLKNDIRYENGTILHDVSDINISVDINSYIEIGSSEFNYSSNIGNIKFLNCSPDWEFYPTYPDGQTSSISAINTTNNGTIPGDFQIEYIGGLNTGWTLYSCNDSSANPNSDSDCITLSDSFQTILSNVPVDEVKRVWLYGNCSMIHSNPGVTVDMQVA